MPNTYIKLTRKKKDTFLKHLRTTANVTTAAKAAGVARITMYKHRKLDEKFGDQWEDAIQQAVDELEEECRRRALKGVKKPVFYQGEVCGSVKEYSDNLAMFLLKGHRPRVYRERVELSDPEGKNPFAIFAEAMVRATKDNNQ